MAVYKIPQDVEADDKFVGPLSFKQFIFIGIAAVASYLSFLSLTKGLWPALVLLLPFVVVGGFLGWPWGRDQPTEIWLAARIRFLIKPRRRIWNQSGVKDLVTVTAPKKIEKSYTDGLSQYEVQSRLTGLATLLDSRGWAIKNAPDATYMTPVLNHPSDDRLIDVETVAPPPVIEDSTATDVLDETSSSTALHFEEMIKQSEQKHRSEVIEHMQSAIQNTQTPKSHTSAAPQQGADFWFLNNGQSEPVQTQKAVQAAPAEPSYTTFSQSTTVTPHSQAPQQPLTKDTQAIQLTKADEEALLKKVHDIHNSAQNQFGHLRNIKPLGHQATQHADDSAQLVKAPTNSPMPTPVDPAIINLASNDDLNIETIQRQAHKQAQGNDGEVVVSLR